MRKALSTPGWLLAVALALSVNQAGRAQAPPGEDINSRLDRLEKQNQERIDQLEKQNRELQEALKKLQTLPTSPPVQLPSGPMGVGTAPTGIEQGLGKDDVQKIVDDVIKARESQAKALADAKVIEQKERGYVVGKDLGLGLRWNNGLYAQSADKAFYVHVGGRTQWDAVWMRGDQHVMFGGPNPTGNIQDGVNPRRARLEVDGTLWEVIDFFAEYEFLGNTFNTDPLVAANAKNVTNTPGPTDVWATITHIPIIGNFRVGSMKPPIGFEHLTSSRWLNFMERSFGFDAFLGGTNNGFLPGVQIFNWSQNENWTWQLGVFKNNQTVFGWNVGGGEYDTTGRITWTPVYEDNARKLVHLGLGTSVRGLDDGAARLRARTLLRNGPFTLQTRLLDINALGGSSQIVMVPEFAMNYGPFTIQAEYMASWITDTTNPATSTKNLGTTYYQDAYIEALLFLTGEHRPYLRHGWSGAAFDRVIPNRNFFWVPGNGCNPFSMGAWQVGVRYDWINFNNQAVNGGCLNDITLGLNWFLNPNMKFQWNYSMTYRQSPGDTNNGWVQGLGIRFAMDF